MTAAQDELLRPADVQAEYGISVGTLKSWRRRGYGPAWFPLGERRVVYRRSAVIAWVAQQESRRSA